MNLISSLGHRTTFLSQKTGLPGMPDDFYNVLDATMDLYEHVEAEIHHHMEDDPEFLNEIFMNDTYKHDNGTVQGIAASVSAIACENDPADPCCKLPRLDLENVPLPDLDQDGILFGDLR